MIGEEKGSVAISGRSSHKMTGLLEVKLELGSAGFCPGEIGFKSLGMGIKCQKWE